MKYLFDCLDVRVFKNRHRNVSVFSYEFWVSRA